MRPRSARRPAPKEQDAHDRPGFPVEHDVAQVRLKLARSPLSAHERSNELRVADARSPQRLERIFEASTCELVVSIGRQVEDLRPEHLVARETTNRQVTRTDGEHDVAPVEQRLGLESELEDALEIERPLHDLAV